MFIDSTEVKGDFNCSVRDGNGCNRCRNCNDSSDRIHERLYSLFGTMSGHLALRNCYKGQSHMEKVICKQITH